MGSSMFLVLSRWLKPPRFSIGLVRCDRYSTTTTPPMTPEVISTSQEMKSRLLVVQPTEGSQEKKEGGGTQDKEESNFDEDLRKKILASSLPFVKDHGWSKNAISAGAEAMGYPGVIHGMFPKGGVELINYFYQISNQTLLDKLKADFEAAEKDPKNRLPEKEICLDAVEVRLRMITPYKSEWAQALAIMTLPPNVPTSLANLLTLVDDICYYAGDRSVDMSWYGKRVGLAGVYKATELFMLQDRSDDHKQTWQFLERRMDELMQLHSVIYQSGQASHYAKDFASAAFTTARNILGLNWNR